MKKSEKPIRSAVVAQSSISAKYEVRPSAHLDWSLLPKIQKRILSASYIIQQKALKIYQHLKENGESAAIPEGFLSQKKFVREI